MSRKRRFLLLLVIVGLATAGCSSSPDSAPAAAPALESLTIAGVSIAAYPAFGPNIEHYGAGCWPDDAVTIEATASQPGMLVTINNRPPTPGSANSQFQGLAANQDIPIRVSSGQRDRTYTLHCTAEDFPTVEVSIPTPAAVSPGLIFLAPKVNQGGILFSYLLVLDNNGVPRFRRRLDTWSNDFKRLPGGGYGYLSLKGENAFGLRDWELVLLDEFFNEIDRSTTVGLTHTDSHDFAITPEGNRLFISYNSVVRDMTAFGLTDQETVGDSVIQEVTPAGQVVFEWNSWDHVDVASCQATGYRRFPSDYAHLNSLHLTADGDLLASFRGCAQIIKIDRPTGDVIWRLGGSGSDFAVLGDPLNEFCGQHTALEIAADRVLMFDNGGYCLGDRETIFGQFSRALEYRLDPAAGQANFVRDYALNGAYQAYTRAQGSTQLLDNGNWLVSWGRGPDMSVTEVTPNNEEVFFLRITVDGAIAVSYRAYRYPIEEL